VYNCLRLVPAVPVCFLKKQDIMQFPDEADIPR
jgi:hypothetical protein